MRLRCDAVGAADRQERDLGRDPRREEVCLAVGSEAREARVREPWLATGCRLGDRERGRAAAELTLGEVGEGRPAGPGRGGREAAGDDRRVEVDDVDQRPADVRRDGADAHPGQRLAQPGLEGGDDAADRLARRQRSRRRESRPARRRARAPDAAGRRCAPTARTIAMAWTSRTSAALTARSVRPRRPAAVSAVWTAPAARIDGTASRSSDAPAIGQDDDRWYRGGPAATASRASRSRAASRPDGPSAGPMWHRGSGPALRPPEPPRAARRGRRRPVDRAGSSAAARTGRRASAGRRPSSTRRSITTRSRSGSIGRVRDLRERLAKVVGDGSVETTATRRRRVVAHAPRAARGPRAPSS